MKTCAPCRPVSPKKVDANALSDGPKPIRVYSRAWISRNVSPSRNVSVSPAIRPERLFRLIDWSAQCMEKLDVTRMIVFTRAR